MTPSKKQIHELELAFEKHISARSQRTAIQRRSSTLLFVVVENARLWEVGVVALLMSRH